MNSSKYSFTVTNSDDSTHYGRLLQRVGNDKDVLELGCSTGYLSEVMRHDFGCRVYGLEIDPVAAEEARSKCTSIQIADLDSVDLRELYGGRKFDIVLCADVLEHLRDPVRTLSQARELLKEDGYVVASIPNISHGSIRLSLMGGRFPYRSMGLLDDTHVRFFNRQLLEETFDQAGFVLERVDRNMWGSYFSEVADSIKFDGYFGPLARELERDCESETYQFVVVARASRTCVPTEALNLIVVEQPGAPVDDLFCKYLSRLTLSLHEVSILRCGSEIEQYAGVEQLPSTSKPYGEHDFRSFRFLRAGELDICTAVEQQADFKGSGDAFAGSLHIALGLAAQKERPSLIVLSNALPTLRPPVELPRDPDKVYFARPEVFARIECAPSQEGEISFQLPSVLLISPKAAARALSTWSPGGFRCVESEAAHFCFSLIFEGMNLHSLDGLSCFRIGPTYDNCQDSLLADGVALRRRWGNLRHRLSFFRNVVLDSTLTSSHKFSLGLATLAGVAAPQLSHERITFSGPGARLIGPRQD